MRDWPFRLSMLPGVILGAVLTSASFGAAQTPAPELGAADRLAVAVKIYALVQQYFVHWEGAPPSDVERAHREYIDRAERAKDRREFDLATLRFVATLRNGHTQFSDDQFSARPLKFRLLEIEHEWVVIGSQDSRLRRGTIVRTLEGKPVEDVVREQAQYVAASNDRLARTHVFSYPGLFPDRVSLGLQDGRVVVVDRTVPADAPGPAPPRLSEGRWLSEPQVAFIRIPGFGDPAFEQTALDRVRQFGSSPNLIVDVRGNGGGATPFRLMAALMNRTRRPWRESPPRGLLPQAAANDAYAGRVFVLVDRFCGSACEDFVMPFKDTGRGVIIGETTQGSSGNPYRADLGNGMRVAIGAVRYRFPDGTPFEGIGIVPDVTIERRISDVADGRDAILERARALAGAPR